MLHLGTPPSLRVHAATALRDLVVVRVFPGRAEELWKAWTDPARLARWWGPDECESTVRAFDLREGGAWGIDMRRGSGPLHPLTGHFQGIVRCERLGFTIDLGGNPATWHMLLDGFRGRAATPEERIVHTTVLFLEDGEATTLTIRQRFATERDRDAHLQLGIRNAWGQSLDKLEELLVHPLTPNERPSRP